MIFVNKNGRLRYYLRCIDKRNGWWIIVREHKTKAGFVDDGSWGKPFASKEGAEVYLKRKAKFYGWTFIEETRS